MEEKKNIEIVRDGSRLMSYVSFWMKNTPHPLSIAYIDRTGKIQNIFDMTPFSLAPVKSTRSVRYALEVPQGWFEKNGIKTGDKIVLD